MFYGAKNLSNVVINNVANIIGSFFRDAKVDTVTLNSNVRNIYAYAFAGAEINNLTFVTNQLSTVAGKAFAGMTYTNETPLALLKEIKEVKS